MSTLRSNPDHLMALAARISTVSFYADSLIGNYAANGEFVFAEDVSQESEAEWEKVTAQVDGMIDRLLDEGVNLDWIAEFVHAYQA